MKVRLLSALLVLALLLSACQRGATSSGAGSASASGSGSGSGSSSSQEEEKEIPVPFLTRVPGADGQEDSFVPVEKENLQEGGIYYIVDPDDSTRYRKVNYSGTDETGEYTWVMNTDPDLTQEELDAAIAEIAEEYSVVSMSVGVIEDGKQTVAGSWGWAVKNQREMTVDTKVRIASLSKVVLGLCAMAMSDDGILDLNAPLSTY